MDILYIDETKLDDLIPDNQFKINGYQFPFLIRDGDYRGGEKIVFMKQGLIVNRLKQLETKISKTIFLELTISNKKCIKSVSGTSLDIMLANKPEVSVILVLLQQVCVTVLNQYCLV